MLNPKLLLKQFGIFWLVFILLQILAFTVPVRNGLATIHGSIFSNVAQRFLSAIKMREEIRPESGEILFAFYSLPEAEHKTAELKKSGKMGGAIKVTNYEYVNNPRYHVNMVLVFLTALFIATPLAWGRRLALAGIGAMLFYLFSIIRVTMDFREEIGQLKIGLYESSPDVFFSLHRLSSLLGALGFVFMIAILIWALLVFTKPNIRQMKLNLS